MEIVWYGHACFLLKEGDSRVLVDPFLDDNPSAPTKAADVEATQILLTHGHFDHVGDAIEISKRTGAGVTGVFELISYCEEKGATSDRNIAANVGGTVQFDGAWAKLVPAIHSSQVDDGPCTIAHGYVVSLGGKTVYHMGDTALTYDFKLVADRTPIDIALVPIGGHFTMDRMDAATAVELIRPRVVIPMHYDTFPPIEADPYAFKADIEGKGFAKVVILKPGESYVA